MSDCSPARQETLLGWILIPPDIWGNSTLSMTEKLLWGRINGLSGKWGYCNASNSYLSAELGLDKGTVSNLVASLMAKGFIRRHVIRRTPDGKLVTYDGSINRNEVQGRFAERQLFAVRPPHEIVDTSPQKSGEVPTESWIHGSNGVSNGVETSTSEPKPKPAPRVKVQKADLDHLTDRYAALKGVRPQGKEWLPIQQGFRRALLDGNTVEQIDACMARIVALDWPWTINTVRRWLPEHRAGKMEEFQAISQRNGDAGGVPEWVDEAVDQYRRIMARAASIAQEITEERSREPFDPEAIPARLRQTMGKMLDGAEAGDTVDAVAIAEMEARRGELEERARDIAAKLEKAGFAYRLEKVRV